MQINEVEVGQIVTSACDVKEGFCGMNIPAGTPGVVTIIKRHDDVYVEFELGRKITSVPVLCHPIHLRSV